MADDSAIRSLLVNTHLDALLQDKQRGVITVLQESTVELALRVLAEQRILSAPVTGDSECIGFVDIRDILASFLHDVDVEQLKGSKMLAKMRLLEEHGGAFARKSLKELGEHGSDGGFLHASRTKQVSLLELIYDGFLCPRDGRKGHSSNVSKVVHRLAIFNKQGDTEAVVSQSDVIRFLAAQPEKLGGLAERPVAELGWANRELYSMSPVVSAFEAMLQMSKDFNAVYSTSPDVSAFEAMLEMSSKGVSAFAVVSAAGKLIGNFSTSELRTIMADHFGSLALPVGEFLALEHGTEYHGYIAHTESDEGTVEGSEGAQWAKDREGRRSVGEEVGQQLICCNPDTPLKEVLRLLTAHRLHRLYVVDADLNPIGLITLTDVLRRVCEEAGAKFE